MMTVRERKDPKLKKARENNDHQMRKSKDSKDPQLRNTWENNDPKFSINLAQIKFLQISDVNPAGR